MLDHFRAVADGKPEIELIGALLRKQDGKYFVIDQFFDLSCGMREHLIEVQRGVNFLADLSENRQRLGRDFHFRIEFGRIHF